MDLHVENKDLRLPVLKTRRLVLRAPEQGDAQVIANAANNLAVSRWLAVVPYPYETADAEWFVGAVADGQFTAWAIFAGQQFVGMIGFDDSLGYWLAQDAWGQGYATEAAQAVLAHYFTTTESDGICACYFVGNTGSCRVLTKLGFVDVGAEVALSAARGEDVAARSMRLTRANWQAANG